MGRRFLIVGALVLLMFVPLFFAAEIIQGRKSFSISTIESVGREWGGAQILSGPQLVIPVQREVTRFISRPKVNPVTGAVMLDPETGKELQDRFEQIVQEEGEPVFIYPQTFTLDLNTAAQIRTRGIFAVPVYQAEAAFAFDFVTEQATSVLQDEEALLWDKAYVRVLVSSNRALRGVATLTGGDQQFPLEPFTYGSGIQAQVGDPRGLGGFELALGFNGAQYLHVTPVGRDSAVTFTSDWPHPSFDGAFLPDRREISESGFTAEWRIPHLARALSQVSRSDPDGVARDAFSFGVRFLQPNDFYQKAYRAARYGILFVALTFLTILLVEKGRDKPVHPVQYLMVGLAQSLFVLLMVAYAELIGFGAAYALSAGATIVLLTVFGWLALKLGRRTLVLGSVLVVVYAVLYMILRSADYALMAGATLAFLALALTMFATRNEDWFGPERPKKPAKVKGPWKAASKGDNTPAPNDTPPA
ncbi:cell envelope integrity protein CreD [Epibacterium ulvae]|uniref:cell envelope integrity protein CreD n=1 Tax=Epibacterium ulvae TaxID=1156985 RepID=UPI0020400CC3|nr:cell envelope integrity protein CreD [Epibacterium ulvae]